MRRSFGKTEGVVVGLFLVIIGLSFCITGRIEGEYSKGVPRVSIAGPTAVVIGACMVLLGSWILYPLVRQFLASIKKHRNKK